MPLPPPRCDCRHFFYEHEGAGSCKVKLPAIDPKDPDEECECGKFRVPSRSGPPKPKTKSATAKSSPWWR